MKKTLLILTLVSALPIAPLQAEWRDYVPLVPFWNSAASEDKENVVLTEKEQFIQSAKKYAAIGAALLALYVVLDETPVGDYLQDCFKEKLISLHNALCSNQINKLWPSPVLFCIYIEFRRTLLSIAQFSKLASLACLGKAGYNLVKAQFTAQSDSTQETINS